MSDFPTLFYLLFESLCSTIKVDNYREGEDGMSSEFLEVLDLFFSEIREKSGKDINPEHLKKIIEISKSQGVYYYVLMALKRLCDENRFSLSESDLKTIKTTLFSASAKNTNKLILFSEILKQFEEKGIKYCVLKGESLARFYPASAFRVSGDIDVLVSPEDEQKAIDILRENDFSVNVRVGASHHSTCDHLIIGHIELHAMLYFDFISDVWFDKTEMVKEPYLCINSDNGYKYFSLGVTDGFIYTFLHAVVHFLNDGMGLRHIADILLYIKCCRDEIDFNRVDKILTHIKYKKFLDLIIGIGISYCGFSPSDFPEVNYDFKLCQKLLDEIETFGLFGSNGKGEVFYKRYTALRYNTFKKGNYSRYMKLWRRKNIMEFAAFSPENLRKRYPGNSYLSSVFKHIKCICEKAVKRKDVVKESFVYKENGKEIYKNREELIKELDMI